MNERLFKLLSIAVFGKAPQPKLNCFFTDFSMTDADKNAVLDAVLMALRSSSKAIVTVEREDFTFTASFVRHDV